MYNRVILVGNLTRDVEVRYATSGSAIGKCGIATNRRFKSAAGEQREEVMFIDLTFFGRTAEIAHQYLRRGSKVLVEGRLVLEQWTAADGSKRSKHSVTVENMQMLDSRGSQGAMDGGSEAYGAPARSTGGSYGSSPAENYGTPRQSPPSSETPQQSVPEINIEEDEIPF